jgi:hypothetical protein
VTTNSITGLSSGLYSLTVTDANACIIVETYTISAPSSLVVGTSTNDVSCFGGNDGTATVSPSGGVGGFSFLWNNGQTTSTAVGLSSGLYCVTISDGNTCTVDTCVQVNEPAALSNVNIFDYECIL